ncbi:MAG: endonuclease [Planctomycetes bacterium]|nr:endonuclease [Planctomycetota bacterium]
MRNPGIHTCALPCVALVLGSLAPHSSAQAPPAYYATVDPSTPATLRATVHAVIDDHLRVPYTSGATDTWNVLADACEDPTNPSNVLDVYRNESSPKQTAGNSFYDREHTWPNSYGFPIDGPDNYPYSDCHMLFPCNQGYNSARGNAPYRACASGCTERVTVLNAGQGGPGGGYPGNSNWNNGTTSSGSWETWIGRRGDVARAILYGDVRYEGGTHGVTGFAEPDLIATDNLSLIAGSATGSNVSVAYMGLLATLRAWHAQDPPDAWELRKNQRIAAYQQNRNPFIDHPEWVECLWGGACPPGVDFCHGDGSGTLCPCANEVTVVERAGCRNSLGVGATLRGLGAASVGADTLVLAGGGMPNSSALYFQGTSAQSSSAGAVFGDGKRCAAGTVVRLATKTNAGGASQFPDPGDPSVAVRGGCNAGDVRFYQVWYRNAAAFCTSATFNLSNGYRVVWRP